MSQPFDQRKAAVLAGLEADAALRDAVMVASRLTLGSFVEQGPGEWGRGSKCGTLCCAVL
eukprot:356453-Chlamydomonas_euryale.AAC.2